LIGGVARIAAKSTNANEEYRHRTVGIAARRWQKRRWIVYLIFGGKRMSGEFEFKIDCDSLEDALKVTEGEIEFLLKLGLIGEERANELRTETASVKA
jgi:argonaute-like protein implicated in RNA metabolism and viral defense